MYFPSEPGCSHHAYKPVEQVALALEEVVAQTGPGLGHRLLMRVLKAYFVPISEVRYGRYLALGVELGFGEGVVEDGDSPSGTTWRSDLGIATQRAPSDPESALCHEASTRERPSAPLRLTQVMHPHHVRRPGDPGR